MTVHGSSGGDPSSGGSDELEVSVVVPVYHNGPSLPELHARISAAMAAAAVPRWDITFVNDGSGDESGDVLEALRSRHAGVRVVHLSRNFGSMAAIQAGLAYARGRCVAVISADLQDPPEMLVPMIARWRAGVKVVLAARESRGDPWLSRAFSALFYRAFRLLVSRDMPTGGFDFFVLDRQVAKLLSEHAEKNTSLPAAILWLGFRREFLPYHRASRAHGMSMWTFAKKVKYLLDSLLSFSYVPLRVVTATGVGAMVAAVVYGTWVVLVRVLGREEPAGWASLMVVTLFFSGSIMMALGLVGEYLWRTFDAARQRPAFVVDRCSEPREHDRGAEGDDSPASTGTDARRMPRSQR